MKFIKTVVAIAAVCFVAGCAGYKMGSTLPEDIQTVYIKVQNQTEEPSIEVDMMKALRAELQRDGRLTFVSDEADADVVLEVVMRRFRLNPLDYDREHDTRAREYRMVIDASYALRNAETDDIIVQSPSIRGDADFPYAADLTTTKFGSLPGASRDLARKVVSLITTAW